MTTATEDKLIRDDSAELYAAPAPSRWGRVAVAAAGAAVVLSRLAGVAHADSGDDGDVVMHALHKDGKAHVDVDTAKTAPSPKTVKSAKTVKTAGTAGTVKTANTTAETLGVTGQTGAGIGQLVSKFASGKLTGPQAGALGKLLKSGLSADDVHNLHVSEFVQALKAAGLSQAQIDTVLKS